MDIHQFDVYVSYTLNNKHKIDSFIDILKNKYKYSIVNDQNLDCYDERFIKKLICCSKLVLCVIDENYFKDKKCFIECQTALNVGLPMILVFTQKITLKSAIPNDKNLYARLLSIKTINLFQDSKLFDVNGANYIKLIEQIENYLSDTSQSGHNFENGIYRGSILNGKMHGIGTLKFNCGSFYAGQFKNNKFHGHGVFIYKNGDLYDGLFILNCKHGIGTFYYSNGERYTGEFYRDSIEGHGVYYFKTGDRYDGQWRDSKKEGKGVYYYKNGDRFEGIFKNNLKHGKGTYYFVNGEKYIGEWLFDKKNDKGIFMYNSYPESKSPDLSVSSNSPRLGRVTLNYKNNHVFAGTWNSDTFKLQTKNNRQKV